MTRVFTLVCFILLFATAFGAVEDCQEFSGAPFDATLLVVEGTIRVDVQALGDTPVDVWFLIDGARAGQVDIFAPKKYRAAVSDDGVLEILPPLSGASSFTLNLPVSLALLLVALLGQRSAVSVAIVFAIAFAVAVNAELLPSDDLLCSDEYPVIVAVYVDNTFNRVEIVKDDVEVRVDTTVRSDWVHDPNGDCDGVRCDVVTFGHQLCGVSCGDTNIPGVDSFVCGDDNVCQVTCATGYNRCGSTDITEGCVPVTASSCCTVDCNAAGRNAGPGAACVDGECDYSAPNACAPGWISCDGDAGCLDEQGPESCGTCGNFVDCTGLENAGPGVGCNVNGECDFTGPNACATGYADCDDTAGCEAQVITDDQCGGCDISCNDPAYNTNGAATCNPDTAACSFAENCAAGFADCLADQLGCETTVDAEPNCGACGVTCDSGANAAGPGTCVDSACEYECDADYQYCPGDDGCATPIFAVGACGSCDKSCNDEALNVQGALCEAGECVANCVAGFADCDADIAAGSGGNGCETDVTGAVEFCGACGVDCDTIPNTSAAEGCGLVNSQYTCVGLTCLAGYSNCAEDILLGCNLHLTEDVNNCGTCGTVCDAAAMHVQTPSCAELPEPEFGACDYDQCAPGFQDCDGDRSNGCETPIDSVDHCRSCNSSPDAVSQCSLDTATTHTSGAPTCGTDGCVWTCSGNFRNCLPTANAQESGVPLAEFGCETDISLNANCGACGNDCDAELTANVATVACSNNAGTFQCQATACGAGFAVCPPGAFDTACTTDIKLPLTCGSCDNNCNDRPNAGAPGCIASADTFVCDFSIKATHCDAGFYDCNRDESDGCEAVFSGGIDCVEISAIAENHVDTWTCPAAPAGGSCAFVCDEDWSDCNGNPADGCETPAGICTSAGPFSAAAGECQTAAATPLYLPLFNKYFDIIRPPFNLDYYYPSNADAEDIPAFAPFDCLMFSDVDIAAASHVVVNSGSCQPDAENGDKFPDYQATCTFDCVAGFHDCNLFPHDGCEVSEAACGATPCATAFNTDARCGWGVCMDCPTLPGSNYVSATPADISKCIAINPVDNKAADGYCDTSVCVQSLCRDENLDWTDGCEAAQVYRDIYGVAIACGQIDPEVNHLVEVPFCDGRPLIDGAPNFDAGRCVYECKTGWTDCDLDPRNGCETQLDPDSDCGATCNVFATVSCGAGVCADCTTLEGTLLVDYGDPVDEDVGADVSPSASTCVKVFVEVASSVEAEQFVCDTSLHYLNPSYDFPSGLNGACQSEFCRNSDGDWTNGCESAQLYGRGPNYNFGNNNRNDVWGVPYIRNPYQEAAIVFNTRFYSTPAFDEYSLAALETPGDYVRWQHLILGVENLPPSQTLRSFVYENPVDCVLSEWSDWGVCTIADDCVPDLDHWLQTRIRTRKVLVQAENGGDCHLPLVEDWFEYTSNDVRIGDGLQIRVAVPSHTFIPVQTKPDAVQADWAYFDRDLVGDLPIQDWNNQVTPRSSDVLGADDEDRDLRLTCAPSRTCTATNSGANAKDPCLLSKWSSWSECSAACDGDYAGGVRIRTREVLEQAFENVASFLCFRDEFYEYDSVGREVGRLNPRDIKPWAGQLYQEEWGCNSHSCAEFNCRDLQQGDYCGDEDGHKHVDCSPLATKAVCDGRDWPTTHASNLALQEVMEDPDYEFRWPGHCLYDCTPGWIDCDGIPDNGCEIPINACAFGVQRSSNGNMLSRADYLRTSWGMDGASIVLPPYQSERLLTFGDGWINRRPNLHPWGKCIYAYEDRLLPEDRVELLRQACFDQGSSLFENTLGVCQFDGECSRECVKDFGHCGGDENNCVSITSSHRCGYGCHDCYALPWGNGPVGVSCVPDGEGDYKCVRDCPAGCWDRDGDWTNGCEVASYRGFPWPDMEEDTGLHDWSEWTLCTRSDNCGLLIDCDGTNDASIYCGFDATIKCPSGPAPTDIPSPTPGDWHPAEYGPGKRPDQFYDPCFNYESVLLFRNVGIQTRFRHVCTPATQGGVPEPFHIVDIRPPLEDPANAQEVREDLDLEYIPGLLIDGTYYQVKMCDDLDECIECTNQLEGLEGQGYDCALTEWSDWGPCSADCNPVHTYYSYENWYHYDNEEPVKRNHDSNFYQDYHTPIQTRTRTVVTPASLGGVCPPTGDTWTWFTDRTARGEHAFGYEDIYELPGIGQETAWLSALDDTYVAQASFLIDARPCNVDVFCDYELDCDALNDYYPGHFVGFYQFNYHAYYEADDDTTSPYDHNHNLRNYPWQMNGGDDNQVTCIFHDFWTPATSGNNDAGEFDDAESGGDIFQDWAPKAPTEAMFNQEYAGDTYTQTGICDMLCDTLNGYTDCDLDLRNGCEPYVYDHSCGRYDCEWGGLVDCTILPGMISPDAAPCENEHVVRRWHPRFWSPDYQTTSGVYTTEYANIVDDEAYADPDDAAVISVIRYLREDDPAGTFYTDAEVHRRFASDYLVHRQWEEYDWHRDNNTYYGCLDAFATDSCRDSPERKRYHGFEVESEHSFRHLFYRRMIDNDRYSRGFAAHHQCDIRWACDKDYCLDRDRQWRSGCEEARNYRYPYGTYRHALPKILVALATKLSVGTLDHLVDSTWVIIEDEGNEDGYNNYVRSYHNVDVESAGLEGQPFPLANGLNGAEYHDFRIVLESSNLQALNNGHTSYSVRWSFDCSNPRCHWFIPGEWSTHWDEDHRDDCHTADDANGLFFGCVGDLRTSSVTRVGAQYGPFNLIVTQPASNSVNKKGEGGNCEFVCASNYRDCDLDPRNGCETEVAVQNNGAFVWLGSCDLASQCDGTTDVHIRQDESCGAGLCANCHTLPGITPEQGANLEKCFLVVDTGDKAGSCNPNYPACLSVNTPHGNCCRPLHVDVFSTGMNAAPTPSGNTIADGPEFDDFIDAFITFDILYDNNWFYGGVESDAPYNFYNFDADANPWIDVGTAHDADMYYYPLWVHDIPNGDLVDYLGVDEYTSLMLPNTAGSFAENYWDNPFAVHNHYGVVYECSIEGACGLEDKCYDWDDRWDNGCEVALGYYVQQTDAGAAYASNYYGVDWMSIYWGLVKNQVVGANTFGFSQVDLTAFATWLDTLDDDEDLESIHFTDHIFEKYFEGGYREAAVVLEGAINCNVPPYRPGNDQLTINDPIGQGYAPFRGHNTNNIAEDGFDQSIGRICSATGTATNCADYRWAQNICTAGAGGFVCQDDNYYALFNPIEFARWDVDAYKAALPQGQQAQEDLLDGTGYCELVQGFDCSFMFSNLKSWVGDVWSPFRHDTINGKTFAEQYHIKTDFISSVGKWGCDPTLGLCVYECQDGWDDCDGDPSNGCEVDLNGPCADYYFTYYGTRIEDLTSKSPNSVPTSPDYNNNCRGVAKPCPDPVPAGTYCDEDGNRIVGCLGLGDSIYACGLRECVDCTTLSGAYTFPGHNSVPPCSVLPVHIKVTDVDFYETEALPLTYTCGEYCPDQFDACVEECEGDATCEGDCATAQTTCGTECTDDNMVNISPILVPHLVGNHVGRTRHYCDIRFRHVAGCNTDGYISTPSYNSAPRCIENRCDPHLCVDLDGVFNNGCEVAVNYPVNWFGTRFWDRSNTDHELYSVFNTNSQPNLIIGVGDLSFRDEHYDFCLGDDGLDTGCDDATNGEPSPTKCVCDSGDFSGEAGYWSTNGAYAYRSLGHNSQELLVQNPFVTDPTSESYLIQVLPSFQFRVDLVSLENYDLYVNNAKPINDGNYYIDPNDDEHGNRNFVLDTEPLWFNDANRPYSAVWNCHLHQLPKWTNNAPWLGIKKGDTISREYSNLIKGPWYHVDHDVPVKCDGGWNFQVLDKSGNSPLSYGEFSSGCPVEDGFLRRINPTTRLVPGTGIQTGDVGTPRIWRDNLVFDTLPYTPIDNFGTLNYWYQWGPFNENFVSGDSGVVHTGQGKPNVRDQNGQVLTDVSGTDTTGGESGQRYLNVYYDRDLFENDAGIGVFIQPIGGYCDPYQGNTDAIIDCTPSHMANLYHGAGTCRFECEAGWADCDGDPTNGCEASLVDDFPVRGSRCGAGVVDYSVTSGGQQQIVPGFQNVRICSQINPADRRVGSLIQWANDRSCGAGVCVDCGGLGGLFPGVGGVVQPTSRTDANNGVVGSPDPNGFPGYVANYPFGQPTRCVSTDASDATEADPLVVALAPEGLNEGTDRNWDGDWPGFYKCNLKAESCGAGYPSYPAPRAVGMDKLKFNYPSYAYYLSDNNRHVKFDSGEGAPTNGNPPVAVYGWALNTATVFQKNNIYACYKCPEFLQGNLDDDLPNERDIASILVFYGTSIQHPRDQALPITIPANSYFDVVRKAPFSLILPDSGYKYAIRTCKNLDGDYLNGCETALGYNINYWCGSYWDISAGLNTGNTGPNVDTGRQVFGKWVSDQCLWDQSVGVIPFYTNQFFARYNGDDSYGYQSLVEVETLRSTDASLISNYGVPAFTASEALGAGFNCDILNRLPRSHTHLKRGQVTCLPASGKCAIDNLCENGWQDCDGNPWNGCETDIALCGGSCNVPAGQGINIAVAGSTRQCSNIAGIDTLTPEELHPFCDGGRIPPHNWYSWRYSDVQADNIYMQFRDVINEFGDSDAGGDDVTTSAGAPVLDETQVYGGNAVDLVYEIFDITTHAFDPSSFYIHRADVVGGQQVVIRGGQLAGPQDEAATDDAEVDSYSMQYSDRAYFLPIIAENGFWVIDEEEVGTHQSFRARLSNFFDPNILLDSVSAYTIPGFYDSWQVPVWEQAETEYELTGLKNYPELLDVSCRVFQRSNVTYPGTSNSAWTNDKRRLFLGANFANDKFFGGDNYFSHLWQEILEVTEDSRFDGAFSSYDAGDREDNYWPLASGRCAVICDIGASDCNNDPTDGCEAAHTSTASCGIDYCGNCQTFPGSAIAAGSGRVPECVSDGSTVRSVRGTLFKPFCRTTSVDAKTPCDSNTCQDVDFSTSNPDGWKNGCEQPQAYNQTIWTYPRSAGQYTEGNGYDPSFSCAWIYDVATFGEKGKDNFNVKHHIDIQQVLNGPKKGYCVGRSGLPNSGKCDFACAEHWFDLDGDPSNGCEWDLRLCAADGKTAKKYAEYPYDDATGGGLDCTTLSGDAAELLGFVNGLEPWCDGWEGGDGKCHGYTCDHYEGFCDPGENLKDGCAQEDGSDPEYPDVCGFDWAHHELQRFPGFSRSVQIGFDLTPVSFVSVDVAITALIHDEFYPLKYIDFEYRETELPNNGDYANVFGFHLGQRIDGNSILINDEVYADTDTFDTFHKFSGVFPDYSYPSTTNKCARCANLDGYLSEAVCQYDPRIAGNFKKALLNDVTDVDYYKPWHFAINLDGRFVLPMSVTGNTHGDYFCRLAGDYNSGTDGQCDRTKCVDEDSFWANGCETAVGYEKYSGYFDYHFPAPDWNWFNFEADSNRALIWKIGQTGGDASEYTPFGSPPILENEAPTGIVTGEIWDYWPNGDWNRGVWCPYLQFWSIATDNYNDGSCYCQPDYNPYWTVRWSNVDDLIDNDPRLQEFAQYVNVNVDEYRHELEFQYNDVHRNFDRFELLEDYFWRASDNIEIVPADVTSTWAFPGPPDTGFAGFIPNDDVFVLFAHRLWEVPQAATVTLSVTFNYNGCLQVTLNGMTVQECRWDESPSVLVVTTGPVVVGAGAVYSEIRFFNDEEFGGSYNPRGGTDLNLLDVDMTFDFSGSPAAPYSAYSSATHCHDFYCPHLAPQTVDTWITCSKDDGKCNFVCNVPQGWKDCDLDPMNGCETQTRDELTCGHGCERIDCDTLDGINPFYDAECVHTSNSTDDSHLDDAHCDNLCGVWERKCNADGSFEEVPLCIDNDELWQTGCETAVNYEEGYQINCRTYFADATLHVARVKPCNGEPGHKFAGKCEFTCEPGWVDCDGDAMNGCEHDGTLCQDVNAPHDGKCTGALGYDAFDEGMKRNYDNLWGNEQFAYGYRAVYDCTQLERSFPGHFIVDAEGIHCDAVTGSITGGLCIGWTCNNTAGYFDCDGDPRNGCEHQSTHENCGSNGECMNCFLLSGNDYNEANPLYILPERLIILSNEPADFHTALVPYWDGLQHTRFYDVMYYLRFEPLDWLGTDIVTNTNDGDAPEHIDVLTTMQFPQSAGGLGPQYDPLFGRRVDWRVSCVSENNCRHPDLAAGLAGERENYSGLQSLRDYYPFVKRVQTITYNDDEGNQAQLYDDPNFFYKEGIVTLGNCPTADDADPRSLKEGSADGCYFLDSVYDYVDFRHKGGRLMIDQVGPQAADFVNPFDRLGCFYLPAEDLGQFGTDGPSYVCSIITADSLGGDQDAALANTHCINADGSWLTGHELATRYDFLSNYPVTQDEWINNEWDSFDCSTMGWVFGEAAKDTSSPDRRYTPTWHVSQRPQAVGCDYPGSGGPIIFDQRRPLTAWQASDDNVLATGVNDKGLEINELDGYRPGPTNVPGFCYYLCEAGWQDCDGDPRNGCEVDNSKCVDAIGSGPTGWRFHPYYRPPTTLKPWDGCETALGYGNAFGTGDSRGFDCATLNLDQSIINDASDAGAPNYPGMKYVTDYPLPDGLENIALMYCRPDTGKCDYTCLPWLQDCDGLPATPGSGVATACESDNGLVERCNCVNCNGLPGIPIASESVCMNSYNEADAAPNLNPDDDYCDLSVCDNTKCVDSDENWRNGCERAVNYANTIRADVLAEAAIEYGFDAANIFFDCNTFEDPFLAAINHVDWHSVIDPEFIRYGDGALPLSYCDGDVGRCVFTCEAGYSDCDGVPHNGCEQPNFLCGPSNDVRPQIDTAEWTAILDENKSDYCPFSKLANLGNGIDCNFLWTDWDDPIRNIDITATGFVPYCVRDPYDDAQLFDEKAGFCHFKCQDGFADCDFDPGCEALITGNRTCTEDCVNCNTISGLQYTLGKTRGCVVINDIRQCDLSSCERCEDVDGDWRNGCETASQENDDAGVFVTRDDRMNCHMMQREVHRNPELFNRHLHIDLHATIPVTAPLGSFDATLPAGTIFCNDGLVSGGTPGTCYFVCETGYANTNNQGYDGCEDRNDGDDFMPEWRRWPTVDFHENNCLYWDGSDAFIENTLGNRDPIPFEHTEAGARPTVCNPATKK